MSYLFSVGKPAKHRIGGRLSPVGCCRLSIVFLLTPLRADWRWYQSNITLQIHSSPGGTPVRASAVGGTNLATWRPCPVWQAAAARAACTAGRAGLTVHQWESIRRQGCQPSPRWPAAGVAAGVSRFAGDRIAGIPAAGSPVWQPVPGWVLPICEGYAACTLADLIHPRGV